MRTSWLISAFLLLATPSHATTAAPDTFTLYGGPGSELGDFQTAVGLPDWEGWTSHDLSFVPNHWHRSTFNAETLGGHGAGNQAMWCGVEAGAEGYTTAPGYGNDWGDRLRFVSAPLTDPSVAQTVELDFLFHLDTEPAYDFFLVDHDSAGSFRTEFARDGTDAVGGVFSAPGLRYSELPPGTFFLSNGDLDHQGDDYGGAGGDRVVIDLRVASDGAYSDEDGLWPTAAGAVQVDDILVRYDDGTGNLIEIFEDFEGAGPYAWQPVQEDFFGDFAGLFRDLVDTDPCAENPSPTVGFDPGGAFLDNEVRSPPIAVDLPGTEDDAVEIIGLRLALDVWPNLPAGGDRWYRWRLRFSDDGGATWFAPFGASGLRQGPPVWRRDEFLYFPSFSLQEVTHAQITLGVRALPGAKTVDEGPRLDNVRLDKFRVPGPRAVVELAELAHDAFPPNGSIDASTAGARAQLSIPFDATHQNDGSVGRGDSVVVVVDPVLPGVTISEVRMVWALHRNPLFDDVRVLPSLGIYRELDTSQPGLWTGETLQQFPRYPDGRPIPNTWYFVLPDEGFFFPGDRIQYYFRVTDSLGRVTTLPDDLSSFAGEGPFDERFEVRGLPSIASATGDQPATLLVAASGFDVEREALRHAHDQLGRIEGVDYDLFDLGEAWEFNGLATAGGHGPTLAQLAGYEIVLLASGDRATPLTAGDAQLLRDRSLEPGDRHVVHFGDGWASGLAPASNVYLADTLGLQLLGADLETVIGGAPSRVGPASDAFNRSFVAHAGCPSPRSFDAVQSIPGAEPSHHFLDELGRVIPGVAAGIFFDADAGSEQKLALSFPFALAAVWSEHQKAPTSLSAPSELLAEVYGALEAGPGGGTPVAAPAGPAGVELLAQPNPFNPSAVLLVKLPRRGHVVLEIFDLRGARVRELVHAEWAAGTHPTVWDGTDDAGRSVASGVYVARLRAGGETSRLKLTLLK